MQDGRDPVSATTEAEAAQSSLPPPTSTMQSYQTLDLARSRCDHRRDDKTFATKQYNAAGSTWMKCHLCDRRWKFVVDRWVVSDRDAPRSSASSTARARPPQPSSSQLAASSSHQPTRVSTSSRRRSATTRHPVEIPTSDGSISSEHPWADLQEEDLEEKDL